MTYAPLTPPNPIFYDPGDDLEEYAGWYFFEETWCDTYGPYPCLWRAQGELMRYCIEVLGEN